ncbi:SRPBCC family protein [Halalkalibacillus halophilus]|uniref:SRPBCC family protein n=1 Tax=Halalkalibacillus halophilus TaxID=392827 RepID=UPI0003F659C7|nr:SRPBCC family protein [Halalkalibacillus halophilus]
MAFHREVIINASVDEVFRVISTYEFAEQINGPVVKVDWVSDQPIQEGSELKETRGIKGQFITSVLTVTAFEPNKKFAVKSEQNNLFLHYTYTFSEEVDGIRVSFNGEITTAGIRNRLYKPLINRIIKKEDGDHLEKVKVYIESPKEDLKED